MRILTIDNKEYGWYVGDSNIVIYDYSIEKKTVISFQQLFPTMTWDSIERAKWKNYLHITPSDITQYIKEHF